MIDDGPKRNLHKPSVEVMFESLAQTVGGRHLVAAMLTGMGADGASAMKALHDAGAITLAQDEATCVVYGMPKAAWELGAVDQLMPLRGIAEELVKSARKA
ncbi:MAG: hypothetical protein CSH36_14515 [Thalassolituus sp.]|nr:MAG: hypothetical protein CSH36_14515 [Thalassolituus sp.]